MSRDRHLELPGEDARRPSAGGGDMPRGGRGGTGKRPADAAPRDPRDVLTQQLELPRGDARERVWMDDTSHQLRASEVRTLAAVGAFRVVDARDLDSGGKADPWHGDLEQLRRSGLVELTPRVLEGQRTHVVSLTAHGQALLESHQRPEESRQAFYAGVAKPREVPHDAKLYREYASAAARLQEQGARVRRVVLDYELKREYQRFLQANNHGKSHSTGRPDRSPDEIRRWAAEHGLPCNKGHVQFPDVRIEYEHSDGRRDREDIELVTEHYNSRQMGAKRASGFTMQRSSGSRLGSGGARSGASPFDPHAAEGVLR